MHALRGDQFKYIRYTGLWDTDELYDIQADPREMNNLIRIPKYSQTVRHLNRRLWEVLEESGGMQVPLLPDAGGQQNLRRESGSKTADFPDYYLKDVKENSK